jgi:hypothetical protein
MGKRTIDAGLFLAALAAMFSLLLVIAAVPALAGPGHPHGKGRVAAHAKGKAAARHAKGRSDHDGDAGKTATM